MAAQVLAPVPVALGPQPPNPVFYAPTPVTLVLKEKVWSLSGDSFTVKTVEGQDVLKVKGKHFSMHDKKVFTDPAGNEIFTLENKMLKLHKSFRGVSPQGHDFEVSGKFSIGSSKSSIEFKNFADNAQVELKLKGDWFDKSATITGPNDVPVATISRKLINARELIGDKQTYYVTVAPNVDLSLIAAACVCLDERENES